MNDFFELENDLKKLRPAQPSPVLFDRIEHALESRKASLSKARGKRWYLAEAFRSGWSLGFGLAAAAVLILFAAVTIERRHERQETVAQRAPVAVAPALRGMGKSIAPAKFVSAGGTDLVYNARDEGLQFADGSARPVRRFRYKTQQTWRWRNPETGASLRVSYPSEEVVLIPVSGQ